LTPQDSSVSINNTMQTNFYDRGAALEYLSPTGVFQAVRDGLMHGVSLADSRMAEMGHGQSVYLWSHTARFGAARYMAEMGDVDGWSVEELANSGIVLHCGPVALKALKTRRSGPSPARSRARQDFCNPSQPTLEFLPGDFGVLAPEHKPKLYIDWACAAGEIVLHLSLPIGAIGITGGKVRLEWRDVISFDGGIQFEPGEPDMDIPVESVFALEQAGESL